MSKKLIIFFICALIISLLIPACNQQGTTTQPTTTASGTTATTAPQEDDFGRKDPGSYNATIEFMAHSKQLEGMVDRFMDIYPGIEVEWTLIPGAEHLNSIMSRQTSGDLPDVFTTKTEFIKYIQDVPNCLANLSEAPFRGEEIADQIVPYIADLSRDSDGNLRSISWQVTLVGMYYRRSIANEYFGNDDPEFVNSLVSDWDTLIETAEKLRDDSNGEKFMLPTYETIYYGLKMTREKGWDGNDGKLFIDDDMMTQYFEIAKNMFDNNLLKKTQDSAEYLASMQTGDVFMYLIPTWGLNFQILPNAPDTAGDWGLAAPPNPSFWGGTWLGLGYNSEHSEEGYMLLEYMLTDEDNLYEYAKSDGDYVSHVATQQRVGNLSSDDPEYETFDSFKFMGGQNIFAYWNALFEVGTGIRPELVSEYDARLRAEVELACRAYVEEGKTYEEAIEQFSEAAYSYFPELKP